MRVFEKIRGLVIWDWYFSGRMEMTSTKRKVTKERDLGNSVLGVVNLLLYCVHTWFLSNILISLFFATFLFQTECLHPPTKIPVPTD